MKPEDVGRELDRIAAEVGGAITDATKPVAWMVSAERTDALDYCFSTCELEEAEDDAQTCRIAGWPTEILPLYSSAALTPETVLKEKA